MPSNSDPLDVNARLYRQIARLLDDLEAADAEDHMSMPQRIAALIAVGRIQKIFIDLRKGDDDGFSGSAVRKYSAAFARSDAARRGAGGSRSAKLVDVGGGSDDDGGGAA